MVQVAYIFAALIAGIILLLLSLLITVYVLRKRLSSTKYKKIKQEKDEIPAPQYKFIVPNHIPKTLTLHGRNQEDDDKLDFNGRNIEVGMIDATLYVEKPEDTEDHFSTTLGRLCFNVRYDAQNERLIVNLFRGEEIQQRRNSRKSSNGSLATPYVKACLLPDKKRKQQTKSRRRTSCPLFNEEFVFCCPLSELNDRALRLTVLDFDRFSRQCEIGKIVFPFNESNIEQILTDEGLEVWREIEDCEASDTEISYKGELMLSLQHLPAAKRIAICVIKGKEIGCTNASKKSSLVHVKICMLSCGKTVHLRKTAKKSCTEPVFNESFHFDIDDDTLHHTSFVMTVANHKVALGKIFVGPEMYVTGTGVNHWNAMLHSPRNAVSMWHPIT